MIGTCFVRSSWRSVPGEARAGLAGEHPVEQDQVGQGVPDELARLLGVARAEHVMAGVLEVQRQELLDRGLVFDHEDIGGHGREGPGETRVYGVGHDSFVTVRDKVASPCVG